MMSANSVSTSRLLFCWDVLKSDKKLFLFPLLSAISAGLFLFVMFPMMLGNVKENTQASASSQFEKYLLLYALFFGICFIKNFFRTGLMVSSMCLLCGERTTFMGGIVGSCVKLPQIIAWTLVDATIGICISLLERIKFVGGIVAEIFGVAYSLISLFVIPIMIAEDKNPVSALMESRDLLLKKFGMKAYINLGLFSGFGLARFALIIPIILGGYLLYHHELNNSMMILWLGYIALFALLFSTLRSILVSALYLYQTGNLHADFKKECLQGAIAQR
jgi:hypothetical protein